MRLHGLSADILQNYAGDEDDEDEDMADEEDDDDAELDECVH